MNIFLIDADNLNSGAWVDEAFRVLQESEGPLPVRRAALFDQLRARGGQVWMTGTEPALFAEAGAGAMRLMVQDGQVKA